MKPRLTEKVMRGLASMRAAIEAGDMLLDPNGDLGDAADDVNRALDWITDMQRHRATLRILRKKSHETES